MRGLEYFNTEYPTAALYPDGSSCFLSTSQNTNEREFSSHSAFDGEAWVREVQDFLGKADIAQ